MEKNYIINIGRQFGSGGHVIGEKLAAKLDFSFYDKELINIASKESGLGKEFFEQADEKKGYGLLGSLLGLRSNFGTDDFFYNYLSNETLFQIQSDVIRKLAEKESCVFVGRCADYILRDNPNCFNIFITADTEDRIRRVARRQGLEEEKIPDLLEKTDKNRSGYYNYYSSKTWGTASTYHLCINSSLLGIEATVQLIADIVKQKFKIK